MDSPGIYPTDIMSIVNDAWDNSFALVDSNETAIADRGWCPLNYTLLDDNEIKSTMTDSEKTQYQKILKRNNNEASITSNKGTGTKPTQQPSSINTCSTISELTKKIEMNYDPRYLTKVLPNSVSTVVGVNLNFSVGRSADNARRQVHESDLCEAHEASQKLTKTDKNWQKAKWSTTKVRQCKETDSNAEFQ